jgi:hypothetical protein
VASRSVVSTVRPVDPIEAKNTSINLDRFDRSR